MRPKKLILCVDGEVDALARRKFVLRTRGYRVVGAVSKEDAWEILALAAPGSVDLLLTPVGRREGPQVAHFLREAKEIAPGMRTVCVGDAADGVDSIADMFVAEATTAEELLERIRVVLSRKRGRKPPALPASA